MLFGDYLVEQKLITEEDLLEALCKQLASTPPLLEVLYKSGNFKNRDLINLVKMQIETKSELSHLILQKKVLSNEELDKYFKLQNDERMPLGQILIEMGKIDVDQCSKALEEFLAGEHGIAIVDGEIDLSSLDIKELEEKEIENQSQKMAIDEDPSEEAAFKDYLQKEEDIESEELPSFAFGPLEDMVLYEFLEVFDEQKKSELENNIMEWRKLQLEDQTDVLKESFRDMYRELHTLKGTVRFLKADLSEFLIHNAEDLLANLIVCAKQIDSVFIEELEDYYLHALDLIWECRESIETERSEKEFFEHSENQINIKKLLHRTKSNKVKSDSLLGARSSDEIASQF
jgi:hypothetical protein